MSLLDQTLNTRPSFQCQQSRLRRSKRPAPGPSRVHGAARRLRSTRRAACESLGRQRRARAVVSPRCVPSAAEHPPGRMHGARSPRAAVVKSIPFRAAASGARCRSVIGGGAARAKTHPTIMLTHHASTHGGRRQAHRTRRPPHTPETHDRTDRGAEIQRPRKRQPTPHSTKRTDHANDDDRTHNQNERRKPRGPRPSGYAAFVGRVPRGFRRARLCVLSSSSLRGRFALVCWVWVGVCAVAGPAVGSVVRARAVGASSGAVGRRACGLASSACVVVGVGLVGGAVGWLVWVVLVVVVGVGVAVVFFLGMITTRTLQGVSRIRGAGADRFSTFSCSTRANFFERPCNGRAAAAASARRSKRCDYIVPRLSRLRREPRPSMHNRQVKEPRPRFLTRPRPEKFEGTQRPRTLLLCRSSPRTAPSFPLKSLPKNHGNFSAGRAPATMSGSHFVPALSMPAGPLRVALPPRRAAWVPFLGPSPRRDRSDAVTARHIFFLARRSAPALHFAHPAKRNTGASRYRGLSPLRFGQATALPRPERGKPNPAAGRGAPPPGRTYPAAGLRGPRAQEQSDFRAVKCRKSGRQPYPKRRHRVSQIWVRFPSKRTQKGDTPIPLDIKM